MALTGIKGADTMSCVAVSVRGKVKEMGAGLLPKLFEKNPYMNEIPYEIKQEHCLRCGNCCSVCPAGAVIMR